MKTIGIIGGMSWESTVSYYQTINTVIKEELGGFHSAKCLLYSVDFHELEENMKIGEWEKCGNILSEAAAILEKCGAEFIVICTNTMHKLVDQIQAAIKIPILHIAEVTAEQLKSNSISKVALLGTKPTMEQEFYKKKLIENEIEVLIPDPENIEKINAIIFNELCLGIIKEESKNLMLKVIEDLKSKGAEGAILGCTELGLIINQNDTDVLLFDTALIHAKSAALYSLN